MNPLRGDRPDITPAQLVSGVPVLITLLASFGVWQPSPEEQDALKLAVAWAAALVLGDAGLRFGRNLKREAAPVVANVVALEPDDPVLDSSVAPDPPDEPAA